MDADEIAKKRQAAREAAPPHNENNGRYDIKGADYRNVFGALLWQERPYPFKRLHAVGDVFTHDYVEYRVHRVALDADGIIHHNVVAL